MVKLRLNYSVKGVPMKNINLKLISIGLITGLINGFFGSGGGIVVVISLIYLIKLEDYKAHATSLSIILPLSIISSIIYFLNNKPLYKITILTMIGGIFGSFLGARLLNRIPVYLLRKIFGGIIIYTAIRMLI